MIDSKSIQKSIAWAVDFVRPSAAGVPTRFYGHAGGQPTLLALFHHNDPGLLAQLTEVVQGLQHQASFSVAWFGVNREAPAANQAILDEGGLPKDLMLFSDPDGTLCEHYGLLEEPDAGPQAILVACDPSLRVLGIHELRDAEASIRSLALLYEGLLAPAPLTLSIQAPVLTQPHVISEDLCEQLIDRWEREHEETGVEQSAQGQRKDALDHGHKRRSDHIVRDPALHAHLAKTIGRCLMPALQRSFAYKATRFEGFKIACYDEQHSGFFQLHRDNLSPKTAHRRFALSLLLNDEYEGGALRFPEYGPHLYKPPRGAGLVFSSSLMHEVLPVTQGRRFVLLSFLFGEAEAQARAKRKQPKPAQEESK